MWLYLTLGTPVFVSITEKHRKLVTREGLQVRNWEYLGEPLPEGLRLRLRALSDDGVDDLTDVLVNIVSCDSNVATARLQTGRQPTYEDTNTT